MIVIAGAGAIGMWLGARLAAAGEEVTLLLRDHHRHAIEAEGLHITGRTELVAQPNVVTEEGDVPDADLIILTCKAHATADLAAAMAPKAKVLASLQNGLGNAEKLAAVHDATALAITSHGVTVQGDGHVVHAGTGPTRAGPGPESPRGAEAADALYVALRATGLDVQREADLTSRIWEKAIVNAAINPVAAAAGVPNGGVLDDPALLQQCQSLCEEAYALSRAAGVALPGAPWPIVQATLEATAENRCSMLQDVEAQRLTEIEQLSGHLVRLGRRLGYPMFETETAYRRIKDMETSYLGDAAALAATRAEVWPREA